VGIALFAFLAIFVLISSAGLLLFFRAQMAQRVSAAIEPAGQRHQWAAWLKPSRAGTSIKAVIQPFDKVLPKSAQEVSVAQKRLIQAGFREDSHMRILYGAKVLVPLVLCLLAWVSGAAANSSPFIIYTLALGLGYLLPDFWLGRRIKKRQTEIRLGLPDFLDLLVVCIEAGLSMDQALLRTTDEMRESQPEISDEMGLVILETRAGRPRAEAWKKLVERVDVEVLRLLVTAIVQADQFGTSLSKTLRTYSDSLRVKRRQDVEEMAAKTAVKLVFPLVFFIFPSLFIVALGPTILAVQDAFKKFFS
jgi:tight adherence protein C